MIEDWWQTEGRAREEARGREAEIVVLTELGFAILGEGLESMEKRKLEPWELVAAFAAAQLHNTIRAARELAFAGYGVQSLALARLADEFLVLLWWIPDHRDQAEAWLDPATKRKSSGEMAKDVFRKDAETGERYKELHTSLHRFAHQDALAFTAIYEREEANRAGVHLGPVTQPGQLRAASFYLLTFLALGADTLARIVGAGDAHAARVAAYMQRVDDWRESTDRQEHARLTALGHDLPPLEEM